MAKLGAKLKLGVQISGRGSNLQALIDACTEPDFPAGIVLVISNVEGAPGLARAEAAGIQTRTIPHKSFSSREEFEEALDAAHRLAGVELICNAGFMRMMTPLMIGRWQGRIINIHPSLLPEFPGLNTHARALAAGAKKSGCTVHFMENEMDTGEIILQAEVPVLPGDTAETLAARILEAEHKTYPEAVRLIAEGKIRYKGTRDYGLETNP